MQNRKRTNSVPENDDDDEKENEEMPEDAGAKIYDIWNVMEVGPNQSGRRRNTYTC